MRRHKARTSTSCWLRTKLSKFEKSQNSTAKQSIDCKRMTNSLKATLLQHNAPAEFVELAEALGEDCAPLFDYELADWQKLAENAPLSDAQVRQAIEAVVDARQSVQEAAECVRCRPPRARTLPQCIFEIRNCRSPTRKGRCRRRPAVRRSRPTRIEIAVRWRR